jgi:hypothetical protein
MTPLLTTIIPSFNAAATLEQAVESLLSQSIDQHEILIVDDGSTDGTRPLAERLAHRFSTISLVSQHNQGVSAARNAGLRCARGKWVHFLDADDWMLPHGLVRLIDVAGAGVAACGDSAWHDERGEALDWGTGPGVPPSVRDLGLNELLERNRFQPGAMILRRDALRGLGFDPRYSAGEDWDLWLRLAERGARWAVAEHRVCAYRLASGGLSRSFARMAQQCCDIVRSAFDRIRSCGEPRSIDCSAERLARLVRGIVLQQATAAAWRDGPECRAALSLLRDGSAPARIEPAALAHAGFWMVPFADGQSPSAWRMAHADRIRRYLAALDAWGRCLVRARWTDAAAVESARADLAALTVPPAAIADRLASRCEPRRIAVLFGLGANARFVVAALRARGMACTARDDRYASSSHVEIAGERIPVLASGTPFDPSAVHLITISDDASIMSRLPAGLRVHRWSDERLALRAAAEARLAAIRPRASVGREAA